MRQFKEILIENDLHAAKRPEEAILRDVAASGYGENATFAIKLALEEKMTKDIRHGNKCDPSKQIRIRYLVTSERVEIEVSDDGEGFCPDEVPDPTQPGFIDRPHGRGIMLMRAYLDDVQFSDTGNSVRLIKLNKQ